MNDKSWFKRVFLRYIYKGNPEDTTSSYIEGIFRIQRRVIVTIKCVKDHTLKGSLWYGSTPVEGLLNNRIAQMRAGQVAWLRIDQDEPFVTIENSRGCFNILKSNWERDFKNCYEEANEDENGSAGY